MKLHLGCGNKRIEGWLNVDKYQSPAIDKRVDLEKFPWPWKDGSVDEVLMHHVLEHLGQNTATYIGVIKELWRVCRKDAVVHIAVPHPRHDHFLWDPTHVRAITWEGLRMFDQESNRQWIASGNAMTPLGMQVGVNFRIENVTMILDEIWNSKRQSGTISPEELDFAMRHYNNVISEVRLDWRVVKD